MTDLLLEPLPTEWEGRAIDPDFRHMVWMMNQFHRAKTDDDKVQLMHGAIRRFFREPVSIQDTPAAFESLMCFCLGGVDEESTGGHSSEEPRPDVTMDYHCDAEYFVGAFQQTYGIDLTTEKVHWWRFKALLHALPEEVPLMRIINIRQADTTDMDETRKRWYEEMKERFALPPTLKGGKRIVTVQEHNEAFLDRFSAD